MIVVGHAWSKAEHDHSDVYIAASREFMEVVIADDVAGIEPPAVLAVAPMGGRT